MKPSHIENSRWGDASPRDRAAAERLLATAKAYDPGVRLSFGAVEGATRKRRRGAASPWTRLAGAVAAGVVLVTGGVALSRGWRGWMAWRERAVTPTADASDTPAKRGQRRKGSRVSLRGPAEIAGAPSTPALSGDGSQVGTETVGPTEMRPPIGLDVALPATPAEHHLVPPAAPSGIAPPGPAPSGTASKAPAPVAASRALSRPPRPASVASLPAPPSPSRSSSSSSFVPAPVATPGIAPMPSPGPAPLGGPPLVAPPPWAPPSPSRAGAETTQIRDALAQLRAERSPARALELLDGYDQRYPAGLWHEEALMIRVEALLALGRSAEALERLDRIPPGSLDRSPRLRVARGELRARYGRCDDALVDFEALLGLSVGDETRTRALRGRAACRKIRGGVDPGL